MKNKNNQLQEIWRSSISILLLGVFSGFFLNTAPSQATNIKKWKLNFFDSLGSIVGNGFFQYDLDTTTFIQTEPDGDPPNPMNSFLVDTELTEFEAKIRNMDGSITQWSLNQVPGQLWWEPSSMTVNGTSIGRTDIFEQEAWFFGDPFFSENLLRINGSSLDRWIQVRDTVEFSNGTWTAAIVPEPITILGTATALGFGAMFKRKNTFNKKYCKYESID